MSVAELIEILKGAPHDMPVSAWDGDYQHDVPVVKVHIEDDAVWFETSTRVSA